MKNYNCTHLDPEKTFERHVYHRDQFAHYLRWTHILKKLKIGLNILDWGCGPGSLLEVIYRNRFKANEYLGLEYRDSMVKKNRVKYDNVDWAKFTQQDLIKQDFNYGNKWDIIVSFEVLEHVGKENIDKFMVNIHKHCNEKTQIFISTPIYDPIVGAAQNHIINNVIGELTYKEMEELIIRNNFSIVNKWGTFASIKDYKPHLNEWQQKMYNNLKDYFDSNILSNLMAPFFPEYARNTLWELKIKE
jgi:2-polyprenyl-3-methyl-5-hydroxy-6-metoxy-1,4-benzoquinol methylase